MKLSRALLVVACSGLVRCTEPAPPPPPKVQPLVMKDRGEEGKFGKKDHVAGSASSASAGSGNVMQGAAQSISGDASGNASGDATGLGGLGTRGVGSGGGGQAHSMGSRGAGSGEGYSGIGDLATSGSGSARAQRKADLSKAIAGKGLLEVLAARSEASGSGGVNDVFEGRANAPINAPTMTKKDALSTFAVDVDTAAYSIARRTLGGGRMPEPSLVRVEEFINYFRYDYDPPRDQPFSIQADGAISPVDESKRILRVGIQARAVSDQDRLPANLVFLVDTSCSMTPEDRLPLARKSLKIALSHLTAKDTVAITTYAGGVELILPPTSVRERDKIAQAIDSLRNGGGTAMESGLTLAYKQAAAMLRDGTITRIIVCSDGDANIGATSHTAMLARVKSFVSEGVRVSTIGFGDNNYKDEMMEQIADRGNGNYYYVDSLRQAERVFGRDLTKMLQDVAEDVKIQVEFNPLAVKEYRLVGYENRDIADKDFRNDRVDAGEIGAGHQVTALYELTLAEGTSAGEKLATVRVRAKRPRGMKAEEIAQHVGVASVERAFTSAPADLRLATAVMGAAELLRDSPYAAEWSFGRVISILSDAVEGGDPDRVELLALMQKARMLREGAPRVAAE